LSPQDIRKKKATKSKDKTCLLLSNQIVDELKNLIKVIDNWIKEEDSKTRMRKIFVESRAVD
jgi:hypothetical protein